VPPIRPPLLAAHTGNSGALRLPVDTPGTSRSLRGQQRGLVHADNRSAQAPEPEDDSVNAAQSHAAPSNASASSFPHVDAIVICRVCAQAGVEAHNAATIKYHKKIPGLVVGTQSLCDMCGLQLGSTAEEEAMSRHKSSVLSAASKRYTCHRCNTPETVFTRIDRLLAHCHFHVQKKAFPCLYCPTRFCRKHRLQEHVRDMHQTNILSPFQ
jgi:hypothetical protein